MFIGRFRLHLSGVQGISPKVLGRFGRFWEAERARDRSFRKLRMVRFWVYKCYSSFRSQQFGIP